MHAGTRLDAAVLLNDVTKSYSAEATTTQVLRGITLRVSAGEFVAIMGPSGSGKSTLMHLIGCLDRPSSGTVMLDGVEVGTASERARAAVRLRKIGFIFQGFHLLPRMSAQANVALPLFYAGVGRRERERAAMALLRAVGLSHRAEHTPNHLSGGEQQRVAVARALINDPMVLLADEPTGNLDSRTGEEIMEIFHRLHAAGRTIIMVTHDPAVARQANRTIHVRDGLLID